MTDEERLEAIAKAIAEGADLHVGIAIWNSLCSMTGPPTPILINKIILNKYLEPNTIVAIVNGLYI